MQKEELEKISCESKCGFVALCCALVDQCVSYISIKKGDIISIPIQAMNKCKSVFGDDAEKFMCVWLCAAYH